jgi:hypothetical protein
MIPETRSIRKRHRMARSVVTLLSLAGLLLASLAGTQAHALANSTLGPSPACVACSTDYIECFSKSLDFSGCKKKYEKCRKDHNCATEAVTTINTTVESYTDRPYKDYRYFNTNDRRICENACIAETECAAWTYVEPGVQATSGRCWLKHSVPFPRQSNVCTSGVKISTEPEMDRPGGDYKHFAISAYNPDGARFCQLVCIGEAPKCRAWTYVKPGFQGSNAVCWLKNEVPGERSNDCCTSGVVGELQ